MKILLVLLLAALAAGCTRGDAEQFIPCDKLNPTCSVFALPTPIPYGVRLCFRMSDGTYSTCVTP